MTTRKKIHCCRCDKTVKARLTRGAEVYPHLPHLAQTPFWICDSCANYVGCHHQTQDPTRPLGCIPTPELREARVALHKLMDSLWKYGTYSRSEVYRRIGEAVGHEFHAGETRSLAEVAKAMDAALELKKLSP